MRFQLLVTVAIASTTACHAQSLLGIGVRAGYTISGDFTGKSGTSGSLQGPELGLDVPIGLPLPISGLGGVQFSLSPSLFASGGGGSGADFRGNVYRLLANARLALPASPIYVRAGAGYSYASSADGEFNSQAAFESQLGLGVGIINNLPAVKIYAEITYHASNLAQVRGWTLGLAAKF